MSIICEKTGYFLTVLLLKVFGPGPIIYAITNCVPPDSIQAENYFEVKR